jgi:hypothetical protein
VFHQDKEQSPVADRTPRHRFPRRSRRSDDFPDAMSETAMTPLRRPLKAGRARSVAHDTDCLQGRRPAT